MTDAEIVAPLRHHDSKVHIVFQEADLRPMRNRSAASLSLYDAEGVIELTRKDGRLMMTNFSRDDYESNTYTHPPVSLGSIQRMAQVAGVQCTVHSIVYTGFQVRMVSLTLEGQASRMPRYGEDALHTVADTDFAISEQLDHSHNEFAAIARIIPAIHQRFLVPSSLRSGMDAYHNIAIRSMYRRVGLTNAEELSATNKAAFIRFRNTLIGASTNEI